MLKYLKKKYRKWHIKRTFEEYGHEVVAFDLPIDGRVEYAQWLHPWESRKRITQESIDCARHFIKPGDTVIDIGAHTGDTTVPYAVAAGRDGCTFALEPNRFVYQILKKNAALNPDTTHIVPLNIAATEDDGPLTFHYTDASFCNGGYMSHIAYKKHGHNYTLSVDGRNLERLLRSEHAGRLQKLSFVKIDAEGYDKDIIHSIMGLLHELRPTILCEVFLRLTDDERMALYDVIREARCTPFKYLGPPAPVGARLTSNDMARWEHFDIVAVPDESL